MENNEQATTNPQGAEPQGKESPVGQAAQELMDELGGLANRLSNLGRQWWQSDQRRQLENDLRTGAEQLAATLENSFHQVAASREAKEIKEKTEEIAEEIKEKTEEIAEEISEKMASSKLVNELAETLKSGLQAFSAQPDRVAHDLEARAQRSATEESPAASAEPDSQQIPIDKK
jgi:methionyl-tRNA synthetase